MFSFSFWGCRVEVTPLSPALGTASCVLPTPTSIEDRRLRRASTSLPSFSFSPSRTASRSSSSRICGAGHGNRVPLAPARVLMAFPAPGPLGELRSPPGSSWPHLLLHGAQGALVQLRPLAGPREKTGRDECCPHPLCPLCSPGTRWPLPGTLQLVPPVSASPAAPSPGSSAGTGPSPAAAARSPRRRPGPPAGNHGKHRVQLLAQETPKIPLCA